MKTILLLIIVLLSSCVQEVPLDPPESNPQMVITSLMRPEKFISFDVTTLKAFSDTSWANPTKILEFSIKENGVLIDTPEGNGPEISSSTYPKEGSEYCINIRTESDTITACTMVPTKVMLMKADYWLSNIPSEKFDLPTEASISWQDPPGIDNYYELQILGSGKKAESFYQFDTFDDPVIQQECDLDYAPSSFVFTDKQFNGKLCTITLRFGIGASHSRPEEAYVVLRNLSEEYYHFKKSWHKHIFLQNTSISWDGKLSFNNVYSLLFQGDPILLYSNVKGGMGIFAAYTEDIRKFKFKAQ